MGGMSGLPHGLCRWGLLCVRVSSRGALHSGTLLVLCFIGERRRVGGGVECRRAFVAPAHISLLVG